MKTLFLLLTLGACCAEPPMTLIGDVTHTPGYAPAYPAYEAPARSERLLADHALCRETP